MAIVVAGALMRRLSVQNVPPVETTAPAEAWGPTSVHPPMGFDGSIETHPLPAQRSKKAPEEEDWVISPLPTPKPPQFQPLPKVEDSQDFDILPLPLLKRPPDAPNTNDKAPHSPDADTDTTSDAKNHNFEIRISNFKQEDALGALTTSEVRSQNLQRPRAGPQTTVLQRPPQMPIATRSPTESPPRSIVIGKTAITSQEPAPSKNDRAAATMKRADADYSVARRLRALPMPDSNLHLLSADGFAVTQTSAQTPVVEHESTEVTGVVVAELPPRLVDRIAAIALEPRRDTPSIPRSDSNTKSALQGGAESVSHRKKKVVAAPSKEDRKKRRAKSGSSKDDFKLAAQPEIGAHYVQDKPLTDNRAQLIEPLPSDFSGDALNPFLPYDPETQKQVYQGKSLYANQRPLVEQGRPWYQLGQLSPGTSVLGFHNNVSPQFLIYGDARVAYASNRQQGDTDSVIATQVNLDFDLKLTGTERFHAFISPTGEDQHNRYLLDEDRFAFEGDADIDFGYFEGDLGAIVGGAINKTLPFDLPFTVGIIPLVFQNGIWLEDAFLGFAATLPAKNSARFDISNFDITFFAGFDKLNSDAFPSDDSAARVTGIATFIEALNGYIEVDYAFLDDRTFDDRSYHNFAAAYTRRYGRFLSNSTRIIVNAGQSTDVVENTADGVLLLSENSLITGHPSNIVPYFNMFAGFDRPQSVARAGVSGGILRNTGILFESDNLTGYPTLDATANDTYGFAAGINILSPEFEQQLVLEAALLGVMGDDRTRNAQGDQYGIGFRYQLPLSNSIIFRADGMMGFFRNDQDVSGIRVEVRKKF